jgi:hypothetical protein
MPEKLDVFPLASLARHDWDELLNGDIWKLRHGTDYDAKSKTFIQNARHQAKRRNGNVRTRLLEDESVVVIQFQRTAS